MKRKDEGGRKKIGIRGGGGSNPGSCREKDRELLARIPAVSQKRERGSQIDPHEHYMVAVLMTTANYRQPENLASSSLIRRLLSLFSYSFYTFIIYIVFILLFF